MKQTELAKVSGVPVRTLAEWKKTKPKLYFLIMTGAKAFRFSEDIKYSHEDFFMSRAQNYASDFEGTELVRIIYDDPSDDILESVQNMDGSDVIYKYIEDLNPDDIETVVEDLIGKMQHAIKNGY